MTDKLDPEYPQVPLLNPEIGLTVDMLVAIYDNPSNDHAWGVINVANKVWELAQLARWEKLSKASQNPED